MAQQLPIIKKSGIAPTVLVSGGAGFIGSHLVEALLLRDARVVVVDNFSTGKKAFLNAVLDNPKFFLFEGDINDGIPKNIETVDYIVHLAGSEAYLYGEKEVNLETLLTNAIGTKNLLDLAKRSYAKYLLVSSTDVYEGVVSSYDIKHYFGNSETSEKKYSHAEAKRFAEALTWEYYKKHKINVRIVRFPEVYGPRMDFSSGGELGRILKLLLDQKELTIYGEGLEKNYYLYVTDAVSGLLKAEFGEDTEGKIFTLTNQDPFTTLEITYLIKSLSNSDTRVLFKNPLLEQNNKNIKLETFENHNKELKWSPKVELKEGLVKTLKWYSYEINTNHFKPAKFIKNKKSEAEEGITSIKLEDMADSKVEKKEPSPKVDFTLPKIKTPPPLNLSKTFSKPKISAGWAVPILGGTVALLTALIIFALFPALKVYLHAKNGYQKLKETKSALETINLDAAFTSSKEAQNALSNAKNELKNLSWVFYLTKQEEALTTVAKALRVAEYVSSAAANTSQGAKPIVSLWTKIKPDSQETLDKTQFEGASDFIAKAREDIARAQAEASNMNWERLPTKYKNEVQEIKTQLGESESLLNMAQVSLDALPELLGTDKSKKYLVLFQNQTELRATGGFIGSYAVVSFENGKIKEITIDDIYNPDGLLDLNNYHESSYEPIKKYTKQEYARIRDSNWQASFPDSANTTARLFKEATKTTFDGVMAIDMQLIKALLNVTGPMYLTAYNEEITSENVYEKAQYYSEALYNNGSQQKKAFLTVLGSKLLETLFSMQSDKFSAFAKEFYNSLNEKHVLVYIPKNPIAKLISEKNWDGKVDAISADYLYIIDSNVGSNKANYFIKQNASYEIKNTYRDGSLEMLLTLMYEHTGKDETWPGGIYTDYLRVLVPDESFLHTASLKITPSPDGLEPDPLEITKEVVIGKEAGKRTFEYPLVLKPQQKATLKFNYTLPSDINVGRGHDIYSLYWQKQPGTEGMPVEVIFNEPFGKKVVSTEPEFSKDDKTYKLSTVLKTDIKAVINLK